MKTRAQIPIAKPILSDDETRAVIEVLESGRLVAGPQVRAFEQAFAAYLGTAYAAATSSGTAALQLALEALGIGRDDLVITTPFTFAATSNAILHTGARPVFVDVLPDTYNVDPNQVEDALRRQRVRAILCVHLYGLPSDLDALEELAARSGTILIEDCAQAHGARLRGRYAGAVGRVGIFSFYPSKNMTTGEGGMLVSSDAAVIRTVASLADQGLDGSGGYVYEHVGYNFRMNEIAAALGRVQLQRLEANNAVRRRNAAGLTQAFAGVDWLRPPMEPPGYHHVYNQYTVRVPSGRDALLRHLAGRGIGARVYYPHLVSSSPAYRRLGFDGHYPVAEMLTRQVLSLPVHPALSSDDLAWIIESITLFPRNGVRS